MARRHPKRTAKIIEMLKSGMGRGRVAQEIGCHYGTVVEVARLAGLSAKRRYAPRRDKDALQTYVATPTTDAKAVLTYADNMRVTRFCADLDEARAMRDRAGELWSAPMIASEVFERKRISSSDRREWVAA